MSKITHLQELEEELIALAKQDKKTWVSFYKLMREVQEKELFKENANTFTQWVKNFSQKCGLHESSLWNRLKAGKVYESYERVQKQNGIKVKSLEEIDVSVDSLVLLDKINNKSEEIGATLVDKVLNKELSRKDLRETYKILRGDKIQDTEKTHDEVTEVYAQTMEQRVTATTIVQALSNSSWLGVEVLNKRFIPVEQRNKYKIFTEFSVQTGTSRKSRRIDVLAIENITTDEWGILIHGIEIKVTKSDLLADHKYMEYANSVDFLWLAIPNNLIDVAIESKADNVGIIIVSEDGKASIHTQAKRLEPLSMENTLINIVLKSL